MVCSVAVKWVGTVKMSDRKSGCGFQKSSAVVLRAALIFGVLGASWGSAFANDVNVAPSACQAPFLDQAFGLRWHESYLMNPASNVDTWVVCPVPIDNDTVPNEFAIGVIGSHMAGASTELPSCFFMVTSAINTTQPPFRDGNNQRYSLALDTSNLNADLWGAAIDVVKSDVEGAVGSPNLWATTVFCKLPHGYSISQVVLGNDF